MTRLRSNVAPQPGAVHWTLTSSSIWSPCQLLLHGTRSRVKRTKTHIAESSTSVHQDVERNDRAVDRALWMSCSSDALFDATPTKGVFACRAGHGLLKHRVAYTADLVEGVSVAASQRGRARSTDEVRVDVSDIVEVDTLARARHATPWSLCEMEAEDFSSDWRERRREGGWMRNRQVSEERTDDEGGLRMKNEKSKSKECFASMVRCMSASPDCSHNLCIHLSCM